MSQTYTGNGDCPATTAVTAIPAEAVGTQGTIFTGPIGGLDFNYRSQILGLTITGTAANGTPDSGNMFSEFQDFIAKWVKNNAATPKGISPQVDAAGNTITGGNPYGSTSPREVIFRIKMICDAMLSQSNG